MDRLQVDFSLNIGGHKVSLCTLDSTGHLTTKERDNETLLECLQRQLKGPEGRTVADSYDANKSKIQEYVGEDEAEARSWPDEYRLGYMKRKSADHDRWAMGQMTKEEEREYEQRPEEITPHWREDALHELGYIDGLLTSARALSTQCSEFALFRGETFPPELDDGLSGFMWTQKSSIDRTVSRFESVYRCRSILYSSRLLDDEKDEYEVGMKRTLEKRRDKKLPLDRNSFRKSLRRQARDSDMAKKAMGQALLDSCDLIELGNADLRPLMERFLEEPLTSTRARSPPQCPTRRVIPPAKVVKTRSSQRRKCR